MASPSERLDGLIATMTNAADALMRHQGQANKIRTKSTRTTISIVPRCTRPQYLWRIGGHGKESEILEEPCGRN